MRSMVWVGAGASADHGHSPANSSTLGLLATQVCYCHASKASTAISSSGRHTPTCTHTLTQASSRSPEKDLQAASIPKGQEIISSSDPIESTSSISFILLDGCVPSRQCDLCKHQLKHEYVQGNRHGCRKRHGCLGSFTQIKNAPQFNC